MRPPELGESSRTFSLLAPHYQIVDSLGQARSKLDPQLLQLTEKEAESRAQYQRAQQEVARIEQQRHVLQGQLQRLEEQLHSIRLPSVCLRFRTSFEMLARRIDGESQTEA